MSGPQAVSRLPSVDAAVDVRSRFVHDGFVASAPWYDRLTRVFSFGLDARWRRASLERCELRPGQRLLDVATGTGELVIAAGRALGGRGVAVGLDFCGEMLDQARRKVASNEKATVAWIQGRAEALPFRAETFDCVTVGFALRHANQLSAALREIARVLTPGGRFVVLEWTRPEGAFARLLLLAYMRRVVPPLVGLVSRDQRVAALAAYLPQSIAAFVSGEALSRSIQAAGLSPVGRRRYMMGLVSICVGIKER